MDCKIKNETVSIMTVSAVMALSLLSYTSSQTNCNNVQIYSCQDKLDYGTDTIIPKELTLHNHDFFHEALGLFSEEMRDFTKEEAEAYEELLRNIYKPLGVNIFDIC